MGPGEQIDWHFIATGALGVLMAILSWFAKGLYEDIRARVTKEEFRLYLEDTARSRLELRENIIKLFERLEAHEKLDSAKFEILTKDFNGGLNSFRDLLYTTKIEILKELSSKQDKGK